MDSILIQAILYNNREYSLFNQELFKTSLSNILQQKFFITHRRVNRVIYIDILYSKDTRVDINKLYYKYRKKHIYNYRAFIYRNNRTTSK